MPTPDDFDPYKVVKDATDKTRKFFSGFGGLLNKPPPAGRGEPKANEPGRPDMLYKASPAEMKAQDDKRAAAAKVVAKRSATKQSPKR